MKLTIVPGSVQIGFYNRQKDRSPIAGKAQCPGCGNARVVRGFISGTAVPDWSLRETIEALLEGETCDCDEKRESEPEEKPTPPAKNVGLRPRIGSAVLRRHGRVLGVAKRSDL